ncbi:MAG: hypothetical protein QOE55_4268, partial [Acidobacteriaceae bacterium]|nr:hypothetical protein [Acidobacteriaceae bacterium]
GFYSATSLPGSAALPFVISTGAERSLCGCLILEMFFDGAKPRDLQFRGPFLGMFFARAGGLFSASPNNFPVTNSPRLSL